MGRWLWLVSLSPCPVWALSVLSGPPIVVVLSVSCCAATSGQEEPHAMAHTATVGTTETTRRLDD